MNKSAKISLVLGTLQSLAYILDRIDGKTAAIASVNGACLLVGSQVHGRCLIGRISNCRTVHFGEWRQRVQLPARLADDFLYANPVYQQRVGNQ